VRYTSLIVGTIRQTLTVINVTVLRALVTEVLRPTKEQNVAHQAAPCEEYCTLFRNSSFLPRQFGMACCQHQQSHAPHQNPFVGPRRALRPRLDHGTAPEGYLPLQGIDIIYYI
jgi:hypothetical protein